MDEKVDIPTPEPEDTESTGVGIQIPSHLVTPKTYIPTAELITALPFDVQTSQLRKMDSSVIEMAEFLKKLKADESTPLLIQRALDSIGEQTLADPRFLGKVVDQEELLYPELEIPLHERAASRVTVMPTALRVALHEYVSESWLKDAHRSQYIDELTGIRNLSYRSRLAAPYAEMLMQRGMDVGVLFIELDGFKLINDHFTHREGDRVLQAMAALLALNTRPDDTPSRDGGDEFTVTLPNANEEETHGVAERIQRAAEEVKFHWPNGRSGHLRMSIGETHSRGRRNILHNDLIHEGDVAMYEAKRTGRGKIIKYDPIGMGNVNTKIAIPRMTLADV